MYIYSIDGGRNQNYLHETKKKRKEKKNEGGIQFCPEKFRKRAQQTHLD